MITNTGKLAGKTIFITGASRGIGKEIALKAAKDNANIIIAAKTAEPHPKLPGTIYSVAEEIEKAGGKALPCIVDVRDEKQIQAAIDLGVKKFGGIDIVINNASAISLTSTDTTDMKKYDLMHNINTRGTFLVSKLCLPYLKKSSHAHILNLSPPLNMDPRWFESNLAYTMAKYGMSMCVLGMAHEFKEHNIAVNALWPRTIIDSSALSVFTDDNSFCRKTSIVADAVYAVLIRDPKEVTGKFLMDDEVLEEAGITDLRPYACNPDNTDSLLPDLFISIDDPKLSLNTNVKTKLGGSGQVAGIFKAISEIISPKLVDEIKAVYQFNVKGKEEGVWHVNLKNGSGSVHEGEASSADVTLTMDTQVFVDLFSGNIKSANAFMTGKLKISGNMQVATKLDKLMQGLKSRL